MIAIIAGSVPGPKLLDIEIANTFPLLRLEEVSYLVRPNHPRKELRGCDHVSVPPDLRLHVSGPQDRLFFNTEPVWNFVDGSGPGVFHYFSFVGLPRHRVPLLVEDGRTRKWDQVVLLDPLPDHQCNESTRVFIDLFLHHLPVDPGGIERAPFCMPGMRLARDCTGPLFGPHAFSGLQRRGTPNDIPFTIRMGYVEMEDNDAVYLYTPLEILPPNSRRDPSGGP